MQAELRKLDGEASKKLAELEDRISSEAESSSPMTSSDGDKTDLGRESVQKEIDSLRSRLEQRKLRDEVSTIQGIYNVSMKKKRKEEKEEKSRCDGKIRSSWC